MTPGHAPPAAVLRPMTTEAYAAWLQQAVPAYAADKVRTGRWLAEEAEARAAEEYTQLLPQGQATPGHHFFTVQDDTGGSVGALWFAEAPRAGYAVAYVYDVVIWPAHRRQGHARRAFRALEAEAARRGLSGIALQVFGHNAAGRALYASLGFEPVNIVLHKPLG